MRDRFQRDLDEVWGVQNRDGEESKEREEKQVEEEKHEAEKTLHMQIHTINDEVTFEIFLVQWTSDITSLKGPGKSVSYIPKSAINEVNK